MRTRRLLIALAFLVGDGSASLFAQDQPGADPRAKQFEAVGRLLHENKPADGERLLDQMALRSDPGKLQLGDQTARAYAMVSVLLIGRYTQLGDLASAERVAKDRVAWADQQYGASSTLALPFVGLQASIEVSLGKYKDAMPFYERSLATLRSIGGSDCLVAKNDYVGLAETYLALNRPREAVDLLAPALDECRKMFGDRAFWRSDLLNVYAVALEYDGKADEAVKAAQEADHSSLGGPRSRQEERDLLKAHLLAAQGRLDEAIAICRSRTATLDASPVPDSDRSIARSLLECEPVFRKAGHRAEADGLAARIKDLKAKDSIKH
jgi:tetratricopeptide (TPR) repeat protein